jgi:integrase/recombinase XerD
MTVLSEHLSRYLQLRRALGYGYQHHDRLLGDFVSYLETSDHTTVTVDTALGWASDTTTDRSSATRLTAVRGFARYLAAFDERTQIPPTGLIRENHVRPTPYIYSPCEITALITAAKKLTPPRWAATMATVIGLMATTGLRPGEVYRLARSHVDFADAQLRVMHSKHGKSRQIPLHPTTVSALRRYARMRDRAFAEPTSDGFFLTPEGADLRSELVTDTFARLLNAVPIHTPDGRRPPRLGDVRHTFAVSTLLSWHQAGVDVQRHLPVLSAFLGHNAPAATFWYLEATPELMALAAARLESSWQGRS